MKQINKLSELKNFHNQIIEFSQLTENFKTEYNKHTMNDYLSKPFYDIEPIPKGNSPINDLFKYSSISFVFAAKENFGKDYNLVSMYLLSEPLIPNLCITEESFEKMFNLKIKITDPDNPYK